MSHVHVYWDFHDPHTGQQRPLRVYTPDRYDDDPGRHYPVLYMHDGQNVFAHEASARYDTWCANCAMDRLVAEGRLEPWLIVGIDHGVDRFGDYSPWDDSVIGSAGHGRAYADFVVQHVKPFIDRTYRTRSEPSWAAVMGASLGGLISLFLAQSFPDTFGRVGALSPSVMWGDGAIFGQWTTHTRQWSRIYLDAGEHEHVQWERMSMDYAAATRAFWEHLCRLGYAPHELRLFLEPHGVHHELDWARRLPEAFAWLLA